MFNIGEIVVNVIAKLDQFRRDMQAALSDAGSGGASTGGGGSGKLNINAILKASGLLIILKSIDDRMKQTVQHLKDASPVFKGMKESLEKSYNLVLQPMGNMMSMLMKPYLILQMDVLRQGMKDVSKVYRGISKGTIGRTEGMKEIEDITAAMFLAMQPIREEMEVMLSPLIGFSTALEGVFDVTTMVKTGIERFIGVLDGLNKTAEGLMDENIIGLAAKYLGTALTNLGDDMANHLTPRLTDMRDTLLSTNLSVSGFHAVTTDLVNNYASGLPALSREILASKSAVVAFTKAIKDATEEITGHEVTESEARAISSKVRGDVLRERAEGGDPHARAALEYIEAQLQ